MMSKKSMTAASADQSQTAAIKKSLENISSTHIRCLKDSDISDDETDKDEDVNAQEQLKLEDQLTNEKLKKLEKTFEEADEDGGGGLDMDEFRIAMRKTLGDHLTDQELDMMFMKVDTNCDGTVDWDEYLSYMLLEYREKDQMNHLALERPFPRENHVISEMLQYQRHHDTVISILFQPNVIKVNNSLYRTTDDQENNGRYVTVSHDGIINFWSLDFCHLKRFQLDSRGRGGVWVTAATLLPNTHMMAVATTACTISFYDLQVYKFTLNLVLCDLEIAVTAMDYWCDSQVLDTALLLWGDIRGNVYVLSFQGCSQMCVLHPAMNKRNLYLPITKLQQGTVCGASLLKIPGAHKDEVLDIRYIPVMEMFMSCCRDRTTSLLMSDINFKRPSYFKQRKGIYSFDFSKENNMIVTGGKDSIVRVWNPYVTAKPVIILQGHKDSIAYVRINEQKEQVISISDAKDIHIFDLCTQTCIQSIYKKSVNLGTRPLSAYYFNPAKKALLLASNLMAVFQHKDEDLRLQQLFSHSKAVNCVLFNKLYHQVVSGGADSIVAVWDITDGSKVMQFAAHREYVHGREINIAITVMSFDTTLRRLTTAARNGAIKIWNFNNGACLRVVAEGSPANIEVTGIAWPLQRILACGWSQHLFCYMDAADDDTERQWEKYHQEDILAIAFREPSIVASASYDGDIIIWSLDTSKPVMLFNAMKSTQAQPCGKVSYMYVGDDNSEMSNVSEGEESCEEDTFAEHLQTLVSSHDTITDDDTHNDGNEEIDMPPKSWRKRRQAVFNDSDDEENEIEPASSSRTKSISLDAITLPSLKILPQINDEVNTNQSARQSPLTHARANELEPLNRQEKNQDTPQKTVRIANPVRTTRVCHANINRLAGLANNQNTGKRGIRFEHRKRKQSHVATGSDMCEQQRYVSVLLFLEARKSGKDTATLVSAGVQGWVYFWSVHHEGGLQGMFNAAHHVGSEITTMTSDPSNTNLITGDSGGYIKVWNITNYCNRRGKNDNYMAQLQLLRKYPYLSIEPALKKSIQNQSRHGHPALCTSPGHLLKVPILLNSFRAHMKCVTSVVYIIDGELILSSSTDSSIRIHTIIGEFVGIFGQKQTWRNCPYQKPGDIATVNSTNSSLNQDKMSGLVKFTSTFVSKNLPPDIRRVASATTLKVLYRGMQPLYNLVKNVIMIWVPMLIALKSKKRELEKSMTQGVECSTSRSSILGNDFKVPRRHQQLPAIRKPRMFADQCAVYGSLPFYELEHVSTDLTPPQTIIEIQERGQTMRLRQHRQGEGSGRRISVAFAKVRTLNRTAKIYRKDDQSADNKEKLAQYSAVSLNSESFIFKKLK